MTILIAGGTGFVGTTLVDNLKTYNWIVLSRSGCLNPKIRCVDEDVFFGNDLRYDFDTFILSVGNGIFKPMIELDGIEIDKAYESNFKKPFLYLQRAMKYFVSKGGGKIIVINSISALFSYRGGAIYSPYKSALGMLVKIMRKENKNKKIKIGQIYLPPVDSPMSDEIPGTIRSGLITGKEVTDIVDSMIQKCENRDLIIKRKIIFE